MEEMKFAKLDHQQLEKINELEQAIGVTLVAYNSAAMSAQGSDAHEANSSATNDQTSS
ncbi:hypothetical protein MHB44_20270 [Lysinibacillus sp. FSL H8-0500]|uniref:hypothetical protein n=1 Tax=Lysinibacillus sp. FSL H8-0500 TaxID=2921393 RepID=UPI0031010255